MTLSNRYWQSGLLYFNGQHHLIIPRELPGQKAIPCGAARNFHTQGWGSTNKMPATLQYWCIFGKAKVTENKIYSLLLETTAAKTHFIPCHRKEAPSQPPNSLFMYVGSWVSVGTSERERKKWVGEGMWVCQEKKERRGGNVKGVIILATT